MIESHLPITAKQARFYPSLFCFCLKFFGHPFFDRDLAGPLNRAGGSPCPGISFLHRLVGHASCVSNTPCPGGKIFAEPQRRAALCGARKIAASAAGIKRKGHLRFPFLFELLPFPYFLARRKSESGDRFENGVRQKIFSSVGAAIGRPFPHLYAMPDSLLLHIRFTLRRRG